MTQEQMEELLHAAIDKSLETHFMMVALVQFLVERKVIEDDAGEVIAMLSQWAGDLRSAESIELWIERRVQELRTEWNKLPKQ